MNKVLKNSFILKLNKRTLVPILFTFISLLTLKDLNGQKINSLDEETFILAAPKNTFSNVDINDATAAIKVWGGELQKQLKMGVNFDLQIFDHAEDIADFPGKDRLGLIISNSIDYLKIKSKMNLYPVIAPFDRNTPYVQFVILVKGKQFKNLKELKNKKLGLLNTEYSPVPAMWLDVQLGKNKLSFKNKFFSTIKEYKNESELILSVFFGRNDVCVVSNSAFETMTELNPQVGEQLNILMESPGYLTGISCFSENSMKFSYSQRFIEASLNLDNYPAGKQILTLMKTQKVTKFKPEYLNSILDLLNEYNALPKKRI